MVWDEAAAVVASPAKVAFGAISVSAVTVVSSIEACLSKRKADPVVISAVAESMTVEALRRIRYCCWCCEVGFAKPFSRGGRTLFRTVVVSGQG